MNKQELLIDLKAKEFVDSLNGNPQIEEVKDDGGKWYTQNIREVQTDNVAVYRTIHFYVVDDSLPTEKAYYKDEVPTTITNKQMIFSEKVKALGGRSEFIEEDNKFAVITKYIPVDNGINEKRYYVTEVNSIMVETEVI